MGDTADGSYTASQLGGYIRREEAADKSTEQKQSSDKVQAAQKKQCTVCGAEPGQPCTSSITGKSMPNWCHRRRGRTR